MLRGELAVPCNLQTAIAGRNSEVRMFRLHPEYIMGAMTFSDLRNNPLANPVRPGREQR